MTNYRTTTGTGEPAHVEEAAYDALKVIPLAKVAGAVEQPYRNFVLSHVNDHCVRMAVMIGEYRWHYHPRSDETFLVLEGLLEIDFQDRASVQVQPGELFTIPAGVVHRTRSRIRTVNLCFESKLAYVDVAFVDPAEASTGNA